MESVNQVACVYTIMLIVAGPGQPIIVIDKTLAGTVAVCIYYC